MKDSVRDHTKGLGATLIVGGLATVVVALSMELLDAARVGLGTGQLVLIALGLGLAAVGGLLRTPGERKWLLPRLEGLASVYRVAALAVFNLILLIVGIELTGWLIDRHGPLPEPEARGAYYGTQRWARQHWREFEGVKQRWSYQPYTLWSTRPFDGETLRIDARGVRRTLSAGGKNRVDQAGEGRETVYAFGGSAMWGHGAPDDATIPAFLQNELSYRLGHAVTVVNFGERAHVATQSLIRLMLELQADRVPDRVVFYHGFNDVAVALEGAVDGHLRTAHIANRLERPLLTWLAGLRALKLLRSLMPSRPDAIRLIADDRSALAREVVDHYLGTLRLLDALAQQLDFEIFCFWQPVQPLASPPGSGETRGEGAGELDQLLAATRAELARHFERVDNLHDLEGVLDVTEDALWADPVHLTPLGNQQIARALAIAMTQTAPRDAEPVD
ncbi:MAG: SGNH/GDSL hydrolase family protein [Acidobacteriota bacterium]